MSDYATSTEGLPKTNFESARVTIERVTKTYTVGRHADDRGCRSPVVINGKDVANFLLEVIKVVDEEFRFYGYNAFEQKIDDTMLENFMGLLLFVAARRELLRNPSEMHVESKMRSLATDMVNLAERKDGEYGASWCRRGGVGAWMTTVRKFDRIETQLQKMDMDIWDVSAEKTTESLEETLIDGVNYLLLILEKRKAMRSIHN